VVLTRIAVFAAKTPHARGVCAGPVKAAAAVALAGNATRSVSEEKSYNLFVISKKKPNSTKPPIHEFKVLQKGQQAF
jgi:hypothetical protein